MPPPVFRRRKETIGQASVPATSYRDCPAKTLTSGKGVSLGLDVFTHCHIVGEVAKVLVSRLHGLPASHTLPAGSDLVAACHDVGKVSPSFVAKLYRAAGHDALPLDGGSPIDESRWGGHAGVSQLAAHAAKAPPCIPEILGQHHGFSPNVADKKADDEVFGGTAWQVEREKLIEALSAVLGTAWPTDLTATQARVIAGLTTVSDWIGSGQLFESHDEDWRSLITRSVQDAGFLPVKVKPHLAFQDIFPFQPNSAQACLSEAITGPGVYLLEAPMGMGKTEAALYAAYQQIAQGSANGIYFALPTQVTSNRIYARFNDFLDAVLTKDTPHRSLLLHSHAWLVQTEMGEEGSPGNAWFSAAKRGLLAPFAVGTLDQALMAVMHVKHGPVRAFGLTGKVVILDEVHSYDIYTGVLLDALIGFLEKAGSTVIILTATLAQERREQLLGGNSGISDYPLITARPSMGSPSEIKVDTPVQQDISVRLVRDDDSALEEALVRAAGGQQILWIENSVGEAQASFHVLAARAADAGVEVGLLHSRFTPQHRAEQESLWVDRYGKGGWADRSTVGRILVGTQILEQSLDIDADFLITRFCPSDMLLQRFGRLWRHAGTPRPQDSQPEAWLLSPTLESAVSQPEAFGVSALVYSPYVLCRSLEVWQERPVITLPQDIRPIIDATYAERGGEVGPMARWHRDLLEGSWRRTGQRAMSQLARGALSESGKTLPEEKAGTRYSDMESVDLLLLRSVQPDMERQVTHLVTLDGEKHLLPWRKAALSKSDWRHLGAAITRQQLRIPIYHAPSPTSAATLRQHGFHHCIYLGTPEAEDSVFRVALVGETGVLTGIYGEPASQDYRLTYHRRTGFQATKDKSL